MSLKENNETIHFKILGSRDATDLHILLKYIECKFTDLAGKACE